MVTSSNLETMSKSHTFQLELDWSGNVSLTSGPEEMGINNFIT
jgi:hypothetical protein